MGNPQDISQQRHIFVVNDGKRRAFALDAAAYSIGRDISNAIVINSDTVSRQHAMLLRVPVPGTKAYRYRVLDGNSQGRPSANGVFVNGDRCSSQDLDNGDVVRFGQSIEASYLTVSMGEDEFASYLESIAYQSIKSDAVNAKATLVSFTEGETESPDAAPNTVIFQSRVDAARQRSAIPHWANTLHDGQETAGKLPTADQVENTDTASTTRPWLMIVPMALLALGAIAGGMVWMSRSPSKPTNAQPAATAPITDPGVVLNTPAGSDQP